MPFYDEEGYELEVSEGFYSFLEYEGMDEEDALSFAEDLQEHLEDARNGDITWEEFHEYYEDIGDVLEEEYGIDIEEYGETV